MGDKGCRLRNHAPVVLIFLLLLCLHNVVVSLQIPKGSTRGVIPTSEFESIRGLEVISAKSGKTVKMGELWNTKGSLLSPEPDRSILILFRSFG